MPLISTFGAASSRGFGGIGASGSSLSIGDVFSTDIWTGDGSSSKSISNGLDLSGEGGMVWIKSRSSGKHLWFDTVRGAGKYLQSNTNVGWSFRKAPGFFDVVQYTGSGGSQTVSHNLGVAPGMIIIREYSISENWAVYSSSIGNTKFLLFIGENEIIHSYFYSFNSALIAYLQSVEVDKSLGVLDFMERIFEGGNNAEKRVT